MGSERTHSFQKKDSRTPQPTNHSRSRPLAAGVQKKGKAQQTPEYLENKAFQQHKFEAFGLQLKVERGTITPVEQERLGVLQAKMDDFWARSNERAQRIERASRSGLDITNVTLASREGQAAPQLQPMGGLGTQGSSRYGERSLFDSPQQSPALPIQRQLTIGEPGDKYEQEADRVASQVVEQINSPAAAQSTQGESVHRMEEKPEELQRQPEITPLQREEVEKEELQAKSILQGREAIAVGEASTDLETAINSARGGGQPLDAGLQRSMGQAMGADFSGVRVHTDAQSDQLNQSIQAKAFTTGQDVFFRQGAYDPGSHGGQELIAHELTHVVQQNGGAVQRYFYDSNDTVVLSEEAVRKACATAGLDGGETEMVWSKRGTDKQKRRLANWIEKVLEARGSEESVRKRSRQEEVGSVEGKEEGSPLKEMMEELKKRKKEMSYHGDVEIHKIQKKVPDLACFNWALTGLNETGGLLPDVFWNVLQAAEGANTDWMSGVDDHLRKEIKALTLKIAENNLTFADYTQTRPTRSTRSNELNKQRKAGEIMREACRLIVECNGMTPVDDTEAEAWVVCQYKKVEGAASPEHWWIELPGGIVIQTVTGKPLEIGGKETEFHTAGGRLPDDAQKYEQIKIGVKGLLERHLKILRKGINDMPLRE